MKWLLLTLLLSTNTLAQDCSRIINLDDSQKSVLRFAYTKGSPDNLGYTMAAIALVESNAGKWKVNYLSNDFGIFQVNIRTAYNTLGVTNRFKRMELAHRLINDNDLNAYLALSVLKHFQNRGWQGMVRSYNEGNRWLRDDSSAEKSKLYLQNVQKNVRLIQQCNQWR